MPRAVVLEPAAALSLANTILAAVGIALGKDEKRRKRAVAEVLRGVDMDPALSELLVETLLLQFLATAIRFTG
jgi:hypothetical protein